VSGLTLCGTGGTLEDEDAQGRIASEESPGGGQTHDPGTDHDDVESI
jgi:hypothetical protein